MFEQRKPGAPIIHICHMDDFWSGDIAKGVGVFIMDLDFWYGGRVMWDWLVDGLKSVTPGP